MADFTQRELEIISTTYTDIKSRMLGNHATYDKKIEAIHKIFK